MAAKDLPEAAHAVGEAREVGLPRGRPAEVADAEGPLRRPDLLAHEPERGRDREAAQPGALVEQEQQVREGVGPRK